jgi:hypothetical protein
VAITEWFKAIGSRHKDFRLAKKSMLPMQLNQDGIWEKILMLYPGRYEYKFLRDGEW